MSETPLHSSNKQIAQNTLYLYMRMILIMCITLYTSRVIIDVLGIDNFGIYNIVGGLVILFSFLSGSITGATQRFLCMAMGRNDHDDVQDVFSSSIIVYILLSGIILFIGETVGLWFVFEKLSFPPGKRVVAITVYQISLLSTVLNLLRMPYNAAIIAYERMSFYAWSSILEALLKLGILFPLFRADGDKLVIYAWLICGISLVLDILYFCYVHRRFPACRPAWKYGRLREILSFTGWSSFSAFANMGSRQGMNLILNIFCGVAVNAAVGVMNQVSNAVYGFIQSFQTAINPPLTKLYASKDMKGVRNMLFSTSRLSYYLLVLLSLPLIFNIEPILTLWLKEVPPYTGAFCILSLLSLYFNTFGGPVWTIIQASGRIKRYQIYISITTLLSVPLFYLVLKADFKPYYVIVPTLISNITVVFIGVFMMRQRIGIKATEYMARIIIPCLMTTLLIAAILAGINHLHICSGFPSFLALSVNLALGMVATIIVIAYVGFNSRERSMSINMLKSKFIRQ